MTPEQLAVAALVDALDRSTGATPALKIFAWPRYPERELMPQTRPDGSISLTLSKWGWEYKHRGSRTKVPPPADTVDIMDALNTAMPSNLRVVSVMDNGQYVTITMEGTT